MAKSFGLYFSGHLTFSAIWLGHGPHSIIQRNEKGEMKEQIQANIRTAIEMQETILHRMHRDPPPITNEVEELPAQATIEVLKQTLNLWREDSNEVGK